MIKRLLLSVLPIFVAGHCYAQTVQSVLNAATYTVGVAPGSWVAIFGTQLAPSAMAAQSVPFPVQLNNVSVTVAGVPAPLNYVSPTQINALIPFEAATLTGSTQVGVPVVVTTPGGASPVYTLKLSRNAPAIYTKNSSGAGEALAFDQNFSPLTTVGAAPLVLYATGLGPTNPPVSTGALGALAEPLNRVQDNVSVFIGNSSATVLYAGLAPGLHAVYQINVVPPKTSLGNSLSISAGSFAGKSLTLPVVAGTNVTNVTASIDGLYPASGAGATLVGGTGTAGPIAISAILTAGTFATAFDVAPGAKPFQVVGVANGVPLATINIDPVQNTWQAVYTVPTSSARNYDFSAANAIVYDYFTCLGNSCFPFPGNIVPLSRVDPFAAKALSLLPAPNSASTSGANGTWTGSGTLPAGGHFAISDTVLPQLENFGSFSLVQFHSPGTITDVFSVYVDNMQVASKVVQYTVQ